MAALRRTPWVLLAGTPGVQLGTDASGAGSGRWSAGVDAAGMGRLTGKIPSGHCRVAQRKKPAARTIADNGPQVPDEYTTRSWMRWMKSRKKPGKTVPQVALNWLITAASDFDRDNRHQWRNEEQLRQNLAAKSDEIDYRANRQAGRGE